jgi:UDPglucose--hexose-1-phosphate uridylyltransferase
MVSELRQDPVTGVVTVLEPERAGRPRDHAHPAEVPTDPSDCPFCAGHEGRTPPSRLELSLLGEPSWTIRVFENLYPALVAEPEQDWPKELDAPWPYRGTTGFGVHEVIVESPRHDDSLAAYSPEHAALLVDAWAQRIREWRVDGRFSCALLFRNVGAAAGASMSHPHSQLIAMSRVPDAFVKELGNFSQEATAERRCILCDAMAADDAGGRVVFDDGTTAVHAPWASPSPYFMRIGPRRCSDTLADASAEERASLGAALVATARAMRGALGDVAFNLVLHDAPYSARHAGLPFHWHVEVLPRMGDQAGFEWGSGVYTNVVDPDVAASELRAGLALE